MASRNYKLAESLNLENVEDKPRYTVKKLSKNTLVVSLSLTTVFLIALLVFNSLFTIIRVSGPSMLPYKQSGEYTIINRSAKVERFDVVVLNERLTKGGERKNIIKRVIGLPEDRVVVINGQLYVNEEKVHESYLDFNNVKDFRKVSWRITVPKNHVFVLGDNRDVSNDSRSLGSFKMDAIKGVVAF